MTIDEARAHIGDPVVYRHGSDDAQQGVIHAVGHVWVFVDYGDADTVIPDKPEDLTLAATC